MSDPKTNADAKKPEAPAPTPPAPTPRKSLLKRAHETEHEFEVRKARRLKPFQELSLAEMVDEIHNPEIDLDSTKDDNAWSDQDTRIEYLLVKIVNTLRQHGITG